LSFKGINKLVDAASIEEGEAQEAINCYLYGGGLQGAIGARKGKTFTNSTAYGSIVTSRLKMTLPSGSDKVVITNNNGEVVQMDDEVTPPTSFLTGATPVGKALTTTTGTLSYPDLSVTVSSAFSDAGSIEPETGLYAAIGWDSAFTITGTWSGTVTITLAGGLLEGAVQRELFSFSNESGYAAGYDVAFGVPAALHKAIASITGGYFTFTWSAWPTGAQAGDKVEISGLAVY